MAAQVPYSPVPSVEPAATPPSDYNPNRASPESFGGFKAQGLREVGAGEQRLGQAIDTASNEAFSVSKFYGQVAADNASNDFQDFATKLLHGDPSKTNPDGSPDTGYLGLRGANALQQRQAVMDQIDQRLKDTRATLTSPEQQLQFDNFSRRYRANVVDRIGTHADGQFTEWAGNVNQAHANLAQADIANNADSEEAYNHHRADLRNTYVKIAQLKGADGDGLRDAVRQADQAAITARLNAVAVNDPSRALALLEQHRSEAGLAYDNLAAAYRGRAKQQQGYDVANQTIRSTYVDKPAPNPVILTNAGAQYGISGSYLQRVHQLEGNGTSPTGAQGPFQFIPSTAKRYGLIDPFDYAKSADAAAHLAADNRVALTGSLGRVPTDAELYLAHQQGADGAAKLLSNPNVRAGDLVGDRAIRVNGGDPNAPAIAFTGMWAQKYQGAPQQASENRKADAFQRILSIPDSEIDPDVRQHALAHVNQELTAQQVAEEQDAKAKKAVNDQKQGDFVRRIIQGQTTGIIGEIAASGLPANEMENLYNFAKGPGGVADPLSFGPKYTETLNRILAKPDDPSKITDIAEIVRQGAVGDLTPKGVDELNKTMNMLRKQPDQAGIATVKAAQLKYYQSKMALDNEFGGFPGEKPFKNQKGLDVFNHEFVPAFEAAYSKWVAADKDPMEFLQDTKQMDAIMDRVYPPARRAADSISADGGAKPDMTIPPAPMGVNKDSFETIVKHPPIGVDGKQWTPTAFATAIDRLRANPTPQTKAAFNKWFGKAGFDADEILHKLPPNPIQPTNSGAPEGVVDALGIRG